jgi:hypothetical protein
VDNKPLEEELSISGEVYQWVMPLMCQLALLRGSIHALTYPDSSRYTYNMSKYALHAKYDPYYPSLPWFVVKFEGIKVPGFITP